MKTNNKPSARKKSPNQDPSEIVVNSKKSCEQKCKQLPWYKKVWCKIKCLFGCPRRINVSIRKSNSGAVSECVCAGKKDSPSKHEPS